MGGLNPNIILSIGQNAQQQQPPNLLGQYQAIQQIQANKLAMQAQQQNYQTAGIKQQEAQMALQQQQLAAKQQQDMVALIQQSGGDVRKAIQQGKAQGNQQAFVLEKNQDEAEQLVTKTKKDAEDAAKTHLETTQKGLDRIGSMADRVLGTTPELQGVAYQSVRAQAQALQIPGADQLPPVWDESAKAALQNIRQGSITAADQIKQKLEAGRDVETGRHNLAGEQLTQLRDTNTAQNQAGNLAESTRYHNIEAKQRGQQLEIEGARLRLEKQVQGAALSLSPQALDNAAQLYNQTAQLPPMGMGKQGAAVRSSILNRAAELSGATNLASNKADYKADTASLDGLTKMRDSVTAFEETSGKNLDLFLEKAKGIMDSGSPAVNLPLRLGAKLTGSANQAAYEAARQVAINEIAKVTSNPTLAGSLSDSARHEIAAFSPENASLKQIYAVSKVLKQDMENRRTALDGKIAEVHGRLSGSRTANTSGAAAGSGASPGVTAAPGVPAEVQRSIMQAIPKGAKIKRVVKVSD